MKYVVKGGNSPLDVRVSYGSFAQIAPIAFGNALQTGFIDGFFLPQQNVAATTGRQQQYVLYAAWHAPFADVSVDYAEDTMRRPAAVTQPQDTVSYDSPEAVVTISRQLGPRALVSAGAGRYGMRGTFGAGFTNIDFAERILFAGAQLTESAHAATQLTVRRTVFGGLPSALGAPSPDFGGTMLVVEQRYRI